MKSKWSAKKVFVTGASGFIGRHLVDKLHSLGAKVTVLRFGAPENAGARSKCLRVTGSVTNTRLMINIFRRHKFDYCYHLAAQSLVSVAQKDPLPTFETNIKGTWNILEAARLSGCGAVVIASTTHVYGDNTVPFKEEYYPRPSRPYETSKACVDILAQTYAHSFALPVAIARFVNIYGPGDTNLRLIPRTISRVLAGRRPEVYDGHVERDYLYIDDAIDAYISLGEHLPLLRKQSQNIIYNFGTGRHYSTRAIIETILRIMKRSDLMPVTRRGARFQEIRQQFVSIKKAKKTLRWSPQYSLARGLKKTIETYSRS